MEEIKLTKGQQVMSVQFNPGQREDVKKIKQDCADMYDFLDAEQKRKHDAAHEEYEKWQVETNEQLRKEEQQLVESGQSLPVNTVQPPIPAELQAKFDSVNEGYRLTCEAQKHLETFQMYAVKAVTR